MIKNIKIKIIITSLITLLPILIGMLLWRELPDLIPTHFGLDGRADDFSSKEFAVFFFPLLLLFVHYICLFFIKADPKNKNISNKVFNIILWVCPVISLLISVLMYLNALKIQINATFATTIFIGAIFVIIGNYMPKIKQNYTMGIKLPWTLNDEENWNKTHRLAGWLWTFGGILVLLSSFFDYQYIIIMAVILPIVLIPAAYSYSLYKKSKIN